MPQIRNKHLSKRETEKSIKEIWKARLEDQKGGQTSELPDFIYQHWQKKVGIASAVVEVSCAASWTSDCRSGYAQILTWRAPALLDACCNATAVVAATAELRTKALGHAHCIFAALSTGIVVDRTQCCAPQMGYNLLYGLQKASYDADCSLFLNILKEEVKVPAK